MNSSMLVRVFALLRTSLFALVVMGTVGVYLPLSLGLLSGRVHLRDWRVLGFVPLLAGACIALRCAFAFAWTGLGTPAPFDAPRRLIVTGMYRYVRNPMYLGMAMFMIGEWMILGSNMLRALYYLAFFAVSVSLFVIFYEEPTLRHRFPDDYADYSRNVPRLVPRLRPWEPQKAKGAISN